MLDQVLDTFGVVPDYDLSIMRDRQTLFDITANILGSIRQVLEEAKPDVVLVHGDTSTALAAALAACYARVPVGHVEAGLRSGERWQPFPEEMDRRLVDALSSLHFAPTAHNREVLLREGFPAERVFVTGNTVVDALALTVRPDFSHPALDWALAGGRMLLLTAHRRESWGEPLRGAFRAVRRAVERFEDVRVLCSVHPNPAVRGDAEAILSGCERIRLLAPPYVFSFHNLLARTALAVTDSGGVQEEAAALGVPTLVLRERTERPEGVTAGVLRLVGTEESRVYAELCRLLTDEDALRDMRGRENPYGDGQAARRIADAIESVREELP